MTNPWSKKENKSITLRVSNRVTVDEKYLKSLNEIAENLTPKEADLLAKALKNATIKTIALTYLNAIYKEE